MRESVHNNKFRVFHQFVGKLDGTGGFAVVETDNPMDLADAPSKFGYFVSTSCATPTV